MALVLFFILLPTKQVKADLCVLEGTVCLDNGCAASGGQCRQIVVAVPVREGERVIRVCRCVCPADPTVRAQWATADSILNTPTTRVFVPTGTWTIEGIGPTPLTITPVGEMIVTFESTSGGIRAVVQDLSLSFPGLFDSQLLPRTGAGFMGLEDLLTRQIEAISTASLFIIDPTTGITAGALGTLNFDATGGASETIAIIDGSLNFAAGTWSWTADFPICPVPEPTTLLLLGTGLVGVAMKKRKRLKHRKSGNQKADT